MHNYDIVFFFFQGYRNRFIGSLVAVKTKAPIVGGEYEIDIAMQPYQTCISEKRKKRFRCIICMMQCIPG